MKIIRKYTNLSRHLRRDEGWNFIEAVFSMALMTVIFLGFTITLLAFREWLERSWAIRVLDQYANDAVMHIGNQLELGKFISIDPQQYNRGAFTVRIDSFNFNSPGQAGAYILTNYRSYSCKPNQGIYERINGTASINLYPENQPAWPPESWEDSHEFNFTEFMIDTLASPLPSYFNQAMVTVRFKIRYERPRLVEIPGGFESREYVLEKEYRVAAFLKNNFNNL